MPDNFRRALPSEVSADHSVPGELDSLLTELSALKKKVALLEQKQDATTWASDEKIPDRRAQIWVQKTEEVAEKTATERVNLGDGRGATADTHDCCVFLDQRVADFGVSEPTIENVRLFENYREMELWKNSKYHPVKGQRAPASLKPLHSRKLGPRSQWDTDDSSQWDSDDSTRTRDFDYFRARLRGDFEWEIDRLNQQKKRYAKLKEKKQRKKDQERLRARQEGLHNLHWTNFLNIFDLTLPLSAVSGIVILEGEPKISTDVKYLRHLYKPLATHTVAITNETEIKYTGLSNLPERICICSESIINILARISDTEIQNKKHAGDAKVVMHRPYRLLTYYDKEIREYHRILSDKEEELREKLPNSDSISISQTLAAAPCPTYTSSSASAASSDKTPPSTDAPSAANSRPPTDADSSGNVSSVNKYNETKNELTHLTCLVEFMDDYISRRLTWLKSVHCEKIFFSDIWHMYKPGDIVISTNGKQVYQIASIHSGVHIGKDPYRFLKFSSTENEREEREHKEEKQQNAVINCVYIDHDGTSLGPIIEQFQVKKFDGERMISTMDIVPLRHFRSPELSRKIASIKEDAMAAEAVLDEEVQRLKRHFIDRGRRFVDMASVKHVYYNGFTVGKRDEVEGQVMIDAQEAFSQIDNDENQSGNGGKRPVFDRIVGNVFEGDCVCQANCCYDQDVYNDADVQRKAHEAFVAKKMGEVVSKSGSTNDADSFAQPPVSLLARGLNEVKADARLLGDTEFMIMSYRVHGFVLRDRSWAQLDMDFVSYDEEPKEIPAGKMNDGKDASSDNSDIESRRNDDSDDEESDDGKSSFSKLVLPSGHKKMVLSLVSQHFRNKASQKSLDERVDIVKGKGKGLIILLHGAPGVGKTTTAEGVAEKFNKPLFRITCGDLGSDAKSVDVMLQMTFSLANRWDCILLIDEADVFLAARGRNDFTRNGLVAVFLRILEYYAGILFLTTNRIGDIDEAFTSRIHMILHYPQLEKRSASKICRLNLNAIHSRYKAAGRRIKIDIDDIEEYIRSYWDMNEEARWNGRQIRNACQTALALAEYDAQPPNKKYDLSVHSDAKVHLKEDHIKRVSDAYLKFHQYLKKVHGTDSETRAKELGLRAMELLGEDAFMNTASARQYYARKDRGSRRFGSSGNPLNEFHLPNKSQASSKQQPRHQYQQPLHYQPKDHLHYEQTYQPPQPARPHQMYHPTQGQDPYAPQDSHSQPYAMEPPPRIPATHETSPQYITAKSSGRATAGQGYTQHSPQASPQPMTAHQPAPDNPRATAYPMPSYPSNWNTGQRPAGFEERQPYPAMPSGYPPNPPTGPAQ